MTFGELFKALRAKGGLSLREFCLENGLDPGNISRLERSLAPPPGSQEKLEAYAKALRIKRASDDWYNFFDLAAAELGRIPADLNDQQLLQQLPVLFRTLRGQKVDDDALDDLVARIRKA